MKLLPINTRVTHFGGGPNTHGLGTIVGYNDNRPNEYLKEHLTEAAEMADKVGALPTLISSFYDGERCPYVVKWDNGYQDVYEPESINQVKGESSE